jgi:acetylornithine deacetylase
MNSHQGIENPGVEPFVEDFVRARLPQWRELFQALIAEESVFEREHGIIELVASRIEALGIGVVRVPHDAMRLEELPAAQAPISRIPGRCSLVASVRGHGGGRSLILNSHLDVVPAGDAAAWVYPPYAAHIDAERGLLYGRGAMDDKSGVTIALAVLETLVAAPVRLHGDVLFQFVLEDETTGNGSLLCLEAGHRADAAVIIDGTRPDRAIDRHAGQLQFTLRVSGRPASVSVSHIGLNAADLAARLVTRLADRIAALNAERAEPWTRFPSPFQCVTQRLVSEGAQLTVPDYAEATCYVTFPPPWTLEEVRRLVRDEVAAFARERALDAAPAVDFDGFRAESVASDASGLARVLDICAQEAGYGAVDVGPSTGTSDLRHFVAAGIPCLLYGPGSGFNPHRADEHYRLDDLPRMIRLFVSLASRWCGPEDATA